MKKQYEERINFFLGKKLLNHLDSFAKQKAWKRSFIIREAIKEYLDRRKNES